MISQEIVHFVTILGFYNYSLNIDKMLQGLQYKVYREYLFFALKPILYQRREAGKFHSSPVNFSKVFQK